MLINNYNIPNEIIKIILSFVNDTQTYKNARLVSRTFYSILTPLKYFTNGILDTQIIFENKNIHVIDKNNNLIKEYKIKDFGGYVMNNFNTKGIIINTIELFPPNKVIKKDIKFNSISITEINLEQETIKKNNVHTFMRPCIIS